RACGGGHLLPRKRVDELGVERPAHTYGWFVRKKHGATAVASNGRSPGFTSFLEYYPERDLTVIVLSNSYSPVSQSPVADDLAAMALGEKDVQAAAIAPVEVSAGNLQRLAGAYQFDKKFFRPNPTLAIRVQSP